VKSLFRDFVVLFFLVVLGMVVHEFSKNSQDTEGETEQIESSDEQPDELIAHSVELDSQKGETVSLAEDGSSVGSTSDAEDCGDVDANGKLSKFQPHLNSITLGVQNIDSSRYFYEEVLHWPISSISSENIVFIQAGSMVLTLYPIAMMHQSNRKEMQSPADGKSTIKLSYLVDSKEKVDRIFTELKEHAVTIKKDPSGVFWGGYSGNFTDPDGYIWEIAYNPHLKLNNNGGVILPK